MKNFLNSCMEAMAAYIENMDCIIIYLMYNIRRK